MGKITQHLMIIITSAQRNCWRGGWAGVGVVYWFHSVSPSVCPSVRPASRVRSVAPTVLVWTTSYLYMLSSNFRQCVVCKVFCNFSKFEFLAFFFIFNFDFVFVSTWDLMWITRMGNHGVAGVSQNAGVLVGMGYIYQVRYDEIMLPNTVKATNNYLNLCWHRSSMPYYVTTPQFHVKMGH